MGGAAGCAVVRGRAGRGLWATVCVVALCLGLAACNGTRRGQGAAQQVAQEERRLVRIPDGASIEMVQSAMGRKPDAVQYDKADEIHYYFVQGATEGETLRFVFRNNRLVGRNVVKTGKP